MMMNDKMRTADLNHWKQLLNQLTYAIAFLTWWFLGSYYSLRMIQHKSE